MKNKWMLIILALIICGVFLKIKKFDPLSLVSTIEPRMDLVNTPVQAEMSVPKKRQEVVFNVRVDAPYRIMKEKISQCRNAQTLEGLKSDKFAIRFNYIFHPREIPETILLPGDFGILRSLTALRYYLEEGQGEINPVFVTDFLDNETGKVSSDEFQIIVPASSSLLKIEDLENKIIMTPTLGSKSALIINDFLAEIKIKFQSSEIYADLSSALISLENKKTDALIIYPRGKDYSELLEDKIDSSFRVIYTSSYKFPRSIIYFNTRFSVEETQALKDYLKNILNIEETRKIFSNCTQVIGVSEISEEDWGRYLKLYLKLIRST